MDNNVCVVAGSICQEDPGWMIVEELQRKNKNTTKYGHMLGLKGGEGGEVQRSSDLVFLAERAAAPLEECPHSFPSFLLTIK